MFADDAGVSERRRQMCAEVQGRHDIQDIHGNHDVRSSGRLFTRCYLFTLLWLQTQTQTDPIESVRTR